MIRELHVENFAIIDSLSLELEPGLCVLTGETGAGKSILIDAVLAALGGKTSSELVRSGYQKARVDLVFEHHEGSLSGSELTELAEESELILSREISSNGRSTARLNGRPVTAAVLRQVGARLVDVHGQHEHQSLFQPDAHRLFLDHLAGEEHLATLARLAAIYRELSECRAQREELARQERDRERKIDLLKYQIEEIDRARIVPGEDEELAREMKVLEHAEALRQAAASAIALLSSQARGYAARDLLAEAKMQLESAAALDPAVSAFAGCVENCLILIDETVRDLHDYHDGIEADPMRQRWVGERLEQIRRLKKKYGATVEEILSYRDSIEKELASLTKIEVALEDLACREAALLREYNDCAEAVTQKRQEAGKLLCEMALAHLSELGMSKVQFGVAIRPTSPGPSGKDEVEFLFSANVGEEMKPLAKVASGGELSRVMLALKVVSAGNIQTLIFDEIDSGVGGRAATCVADKLKLLANHCQVLCVTHMPQIACAADAHYAIEKQRVLEAGTERTVVRVRRLDQEERVEELARMLAGESVSDTTRAQAKELLARYRTK
ncbi:MAG: DNA repair protein RecN [Bacillota bacterium]